jgi:acyl-CoA synthetase (NDP forming)
MSKVVAVIGASSDRSKFGNKAVRAFARQGYTVVPIHPREQEVEGWKAYSSVLDVPGAIDMATMYLPPALGERVLEDLAKKDSPALVDRARELGLKTMVACSILGIGESPAAF